jgi:signal transduction histidine kinase/ligand-binding sensor domain-containing protein
MSLVATARSASALEPGERFHRYEHRAWPSVARAAEVSALALSADGNLWVGTSDGLVRFDGRHMVAFEPPRYPGLVAGSVRQMLMASDGTLWLGGGGRGIFRLRGTTITALGPRQGVPGGRTSALAETADGTIWIASGGSVARLPPGAARALPASEGLSGASVRVLCPDLDGGVWAGLHEGVARWDAGARTWRPEPGPLPSTADVDALWMDADGTLWAGTARDGLWERRNGTWRAHQVSDGLASGIVAVLRDRGGHLWVATGAGLVSQDPATGRFQPFPLPADMCGDRINTIAEDAEGGLWIGTQTCGLHRLHDRAFRTLGEEDGLPADTVIGLRLIAGHTVWMSSYGHGLAHWPLDRFAPQVAPCARELPCQECWDFSASTGPSGELLVVCHKKTVLRWDGTSLKRLAALPAGLPAASFVLAAGDGARWFAYDPEIVRSVDGVAGPVRGLEPLSGHRVLHEGADGTIWILGNNGVGAWRRGEVRVSMLPPGVRPAEAWNAHEDSDRTLWFGTKGEGIRRLKNGRITTVGVANGLPDGMVVQILEDEQGRLWASSSKGIFWVKKRELEAVADGTRPTIEAHLYDASDGIQMGRVSTFGHPAGFKDPGGRLWFGTHGGLVIFDPATLRSQPPRPVIEELRVGGQPVDDRRSVTARAPADLEATFAAATFGALDAISFRYRLWGRDADWVPGSASRSAHYGQLEAGSYQFVVEARDREGDWGGPTAQIAFTLRPPFYRSSPFVLLCAVGAGLALLLVHRLRIAQTRAGLHAVMAERTRIARDIHDTLAQAFVATSVQLECLEEGLGRDPPANVRRHLETARKLVVESLDEARRAVWVLRPQAIELGLAAALQTLVSRLSGTPTIELQVLGSARPLPPAIASELLRIAQEGVSNARRHARAGRIDVRLAFLPRSVTLTIADDGQGLAGGEASPGGGQGLIGMKERAAGIGAVLSIESAPGRGTTVRVEVAG